MLGNRGRKRSVSAIVLFLLIFTAIFGAVPSAYSGATLSDIEGHWAYSTLQMMKTHGIITGYKDGTFRPDRYITRAEFVTLLVRALNLEHAEEKVFADTKGHWAKSEIATANYHGIVSGVENNLFLPNEPMTREQMAVMVTNATKITAGNNIQSFSDRSQIAYWAKLSVAKAAAAGLISGYPDQTFRPKQKTTRAEAAVVLSRCAGLLPTYVKTGVFGPEQGRQTVRGNLVVSGDGVVLQNLTIEGNLTIAEAVGNGTVTLNNIIVKGSTLVRGGGKDSIHINGGQYSKVIVHKTASGNVRIVATNVSGMQVVIAEDASGETIILEGTFAHLEVHAPNTQIVTRGVTVIQSFLIAETAVNTTVTLSDETTVALMTVRANTNVLGRGVINRCEVYSNNVSFAVRPSTLIDYTRNGGSGGTDSDWGGATLSYNLTVVSNPAAGGTVTGSGRYQSGENVLLNAAANISEGYEFVNWTVNGNQVSTEASFEFTMTGNNVVAVANFIVTGSISVATAADLYNIRNNLNGNYVQVANIDLGVFPYNDGQGWQPIGHYEIVDDWDVNQYPFTGIYDGNGFTIANLVINNSNEETLSAGLFGLCGEDAQLKNIVLEDVHIIGDWLVGALVGDNYGSITNASVSGVVTGRGTVGGLVGDNLGIISASRALAEVSGEYEAGGLAGGNYGTITGSNAAASVIGDYNVGGLAGGNYGQIIDSSAAGAVAGQENVGGLAGCNYEAIVNSFATGSVTGEYRVGGLAGVNEGSVAASYATGSVAGIEEVGGLAGGNWRGAISNSYGLNSGLYRLADSTEVTFGRITGHYYHSVLENNFARNDMMEPFAGAYSEKLHNGKDGGDLHSWQLDQGGTVIAVPEKSIYSLSIELPGAFVESQEAPAVVTIASESVGYSGYGNVGVNVSASGAAVQLPAAWENGFAIENDFSATESITLLWNNAGNYSLTVDLVDLDNNGQIIASDSITVSVAYTVATAEDLHNIRNLPNANYVQVADIDLQGINWIPIGSWSPAFRGSYDGNGYKITNLTIDNLSDPTKDYNVGLFGYAEGAVFKNVILENVSVIGKLYVGGLVGWLNSGTIKNSHVAGIVTGQIAAGGLVGFSNGTIEECSTSGAVYGTHLGVNGIVGETGGLVGANGDTGEVISSFSSAQVDTNATGGSGVIGYTGGLVGRNNGKVILSYATGTANLTGAFKYYVGGLVGTNGVAGSITESYAVGQVTGIISGGIAGGNSGIIEKSYYDRETTTMDDEKGFPRETTEMTQQITFAGWDFARIWTIEEGSSYPYLRWQGNNNIPYPPMNQD